MEVLFKDNTTLNRTKNFHMRKQDIMEFWNRDTVNGIGARQRDGRSGVRIPEQVREYIFYIMV
jgi:hypothetical protein